MSIRRTRIVRLRDLADRQERVARMELARAETSLRSARSAKALMLRHTFAHLDHGLPARFGQALIAASVASAARHEATIVELDSQVRDADRAWTQRRQHAGSIGKLYERIDVKERLEAERAAEGELEDVIAGRIAMRNARWVSRRRSRRSGPVIAGGIA